MLIKKLLFSVEIRVSEKSHDLLTLTKQRLATINSIWLGIIYKAEPGTDPLLEKADPISKFAVWVKDLYLTNLRALISDMTILFQILAQKYRGKVFLVTNLGIFVFFKKKFVIRLNFVSFFRILAQKYPNKGFFVPDLGIYVCFGFWFLFFVFCFVVFFSGGGGWGGEGGILQLDKLEGFDFKYSHSFLKF